jgi:hypothetical protein
VTTAPSVRKATRLQDAVRLLFIIAYGGTSTDEATSGVPGAVAKLATATRLHALDFWVRNPDYLAYEILTMVQAGDLDRAYLPMVERIFDDGEPDLRLFPMLRWRFGAYEGVDDALALLRAHGLIAIRRTGSLKKISRHSYYLLEVGRRRSEELLAEAPELGWYRDRAQLAASVAGATPGPQLKLRQKEQAEYMDAQLGTYIPSIVGRATELLRALQGTP